MQNEYRYIYDTFDNFRMEKSYVIWFIVNNFPHVVSLLLKKKENDLAKNTILRLISRLLMRDQKGSRGKQFSHWYYCYRYRVYEQYKLVDLQLISRGFNQY